MLYPRTEWNSTAFYTSKHPELGVDVASSFILLFSTLEELAAPLRDEVRLRRWHDRNGGLSAVTRN